MIKKHVKGILQVYRHSHDVTSKLHHFNQIIKELVSSSEDEEDAFRIDEVEDMHHAETYFLPPVTQVLKNEYVPEQPRPEKIRNVKTRDEGRCYSKCRVGVKVECRRIYIWS